MKKRIIKVKKGQSFRSKLNLMNPCSEGFNWVGEKSLRTFWKTCPRGDWMLWLAFRAGVDPKLMVLAACKCARLVLRYVKDGTQSGRAIELGERFAAGNRVTSAMLRKARKLAREESDRQRTMSRYHAAAAAADAVFAGMDEDCGWLTCCEVVDVLEEEWISLRGESSQKCADIVRRHIPLAVIEKAMKHRKASS